MMQQVAWTTSERGENLAESARVPLSRGIHGQGQTEGSSVQSAEDVLRQMESEWTAVSLPSLGAGADR